MIHWKRSQYFLQDTNIRFRIMGKRKSINLAKLYPHPLPITISNERYGPLPSLFLHNPISWLWFAIRYFHIQYQHVPQSQVTKINVDYEDGIFMVKDELDMQRLWRNGFFGKGAFSRSEPSWIQRTSRRLNLTHFSDVMAIEEVTTARRNERRKFKGLRSEYQALEAKNRANPLDETEMTDAEEIRIQLDNYRDNLTEPNIPQSDFDIISVREEDKEIINQETKSIVKNLEFLQLDSYEAFFLKSALNVIDIYWANQLCSLYHLLEELCDGYPRPSSPFILRYVVYHHFRSLGWCVRSGVKFGCDMLLYRRGPPFSHADHSVVVMPCDGSDKINWYNMSAVLRVMGTVKKNLVLVFVDVPAEARFYSLLQKVSNDSEKGWLDSLLKQFKVTEIVLRRWVPSKTRD
ncbi:uncharacterized protein PRCAT00001144001 [Priceomyces carsonii]|uniref:uncharacterized protein n=1 Tax=Priceomyces carsonii TaxID=28549 RepID=UPI002ED94AFB|nr:unnamed protein product [Priceomyces carsonii]